jgi:hypothetical protein
MNCHKGFGVDGIGISSQLINLFFEVVILLSGTGSSTELFSHVE